MEFLQQWSQRVARAVLVVSALVSTACASTGADEELHYTADGAGRTIVFVHGWTCDLSVWTDQLATFARGYRVIALDLPGHGQSPAPADGVYSMDRFADAVESVRAGAGAEEIVLVGHSMGVPVIGQYALRYPQHVAGLVAVDGSLPLPATGEQEEVPLPSAGEPWREGMIEAMFVPATPDDVRQRVRQMMRRGSDEQALGIAMSMRDPLRWDNGPVDAPMLAVIAGTRSLPDPALYEELVPRLQTRQLPGRHGRRAGRLPAAPTHEPANLPDAAGLVHRRPPPAQPATPGVVKPTRAAASDAVTATQARPEVAPATAATTRPAAPARPGARGSGQSPLGPRC